jgi:hypothetical protein
MSGWGKSYHLQAMLEAAIPEFNVAPILDYKDEYRGLCKAGLATHYLVGPNETAWSVADWKAFLQANGAVDLARHNLGSEAWRETCGRIVRAARALASGTNPVLVAIDEAHIVAPQREKVPKTIEELATTGRGEGASSVWATQRLATMEKTVVTQADETIVGGLMKSQDRKQIDAEYPERIHNPQAGEIARLPEELHADDGPHALRKFTEDGSTVGSEWVYADDSGTLERRNTRGVSMDSTHYGPEGHDIPDPTYQ